MTDHSLDPSAIDCLRQLVSDADPDLVIDILSMFRSDVPERIRAIVRALDAADLDAAADVAHTAKSSAGTVGARRLQSLFQQLEDAARANEEAVARARLADVTAEYAVVEPLLPHE